MGIVDTLSAGFSLVNKRLWLLSIPILLDLLLWMGPQVSIAPFITRALDWYQGFIAQTTTDLAPYYQQTPQEAAQVLEQMGQAGESLGQGNLLEVLAWQMPSIVRGAPSDLGLRTIFFVEDGGALLLAIVGLLAGGLFVASLFLSVIAQSITGEGLSGSRFASNIFGNWARLSAYFLLMTAAAAILIPLALLVVGAIGMASASIASFIGALLGAAVLWLALYLFFVDDAIFISQSGPIRAIRNSFGVVHGNFWSSLGIFAIINVILWGTPIAWSFLMRHPLGIVASIVGNAYIATGLTAASMIYYRQRYSLGRGN